MLEAFKIMSAGGKKTQATADELQALINTAEEERSALSEMQRWKAGGPRTKRHTSPNEPPQPGTPTGITP